MIFNPKTGQAYRLRGDIRIAYWDKYSGTCGQLGIPASNDLWAQPSPGFGGQAATSPQGTTGAYQQFDNGTIYSSLHGTYATIGNLKTLHNSLGGTGGQWGFPTGDTYIDKKGSQCQWFEGGLLCAGPEYKDNHDELLLFMGEDTRGKTASEICKMAQEGRIAVINGSSHYYEQCSGAHYVTSYENPETGEFIPSSSASIGLVGITALDPIPGDEIVTVLGLLVVAGIAYLAGLAYSDKIKTHLKAQSEARYADINPDDLDWNNHPKKTTKQSSSDMQFDETQLQKKFEHADQFGVEGSYNPENAARFEQALRAHIDSPDTIAIKGTYRGTQSVTHYFNPTTNLNVMIDENQEFLSGWKLSSEQISNLWRSFNIQ